MKTRNMILAGLLAMGIVLAGCWDMGGEGKGGDGLAPPSTISAEGASPTSIALTWNTVSGAVKYKIYTALAATSGNYQFVDEAENNNYEVSGLLPSSTHYFKVSSVDINGIEGPQSVYVEGRTTEGGLPAPTGLNAQAASPTGIRLEWTAVSGAVSYKVYRGVTATSGAYQYVDETPYNYYCCAHAELADLDQSI